MPAARSRKAAASHLPAGFRIDELVIGAFEWIPRFDITPDGGAARPEEVLLRCAGRLRREDFG
jgi:hypothetical protein